MLKKLLQTADELHERIRRYRPFEDQNLLHEIRKYYRIEIVYSSNALEGCTYTITETKILLEDGLTAAGKPFRDACAVVGLAKAYDHMFALLHKRGLTEEDILLMHRMLGDGLDNRVQPGEYRKIPVFLTGSAYSLPDAQEVPALMASLISDLQSSLQNLQGSQQDNPSLHPIVQAALFHKNFAFIHPFADGNGRLARLAMNVLLIQHGYLPVVIAPVLRREYINCLEKAHINSRKFVEFIVRGEIDSQKELLRLLNDHKKNTRETQTSCNILTTRLDEEAEERKTRMH